MSPRGRAVLWCSTLQLCAAHSVHAEPPYAEGAHEHHEDEGAGWLQEREREISRSLVHDAKGSATTNTWVSAKVAGDGIAHFQDRSTLSTAHAATWYDQQYNERIRQTVAPPSESEHGIGVYDPMRDAPLITMRFRFDLYDLIADSHHAARAQILDNSERKRTWLSLQDRLCSSLDSRALKEYLDEALPKLPAALHKQALFETHDACADSVLGALARPLIQQAAQQSFPRQSNDAFTAAELKALNENRVASHRFEPYEN
jgi:hypothetical protein